MAQILVFGDSITYGAWDKEGGWVQRLRRFLDEKYPREFFVYNLGVPIDETSDNVLIRIKNESKARTSLGFEDKNIIIFAIGVNDSQFLHSKNACRIPIERFKENIKKLIEIAKKFTPKIIFVGLTPVDETKTTPIPWNVDKSYKNEYIKKYDEAIKSICKENKVNFIGIFKKLINLNYQELLEDGLHPNSKGHQKIFEIVKDFLIENKIIYLKPY